MLDPSSFPKGTILNTYGDNTGNLFRKFVYAQIRRYQKRKYPHSNRTDAIHTMIHVGSGDYLSVEHPRAVITKPDLSSGCRYSFWQYKYLEQFDGAAWVAFDAAVREIEGTRYDYGQLMDILVHQLFGWLPSKLSIFDFSRKRKVCSVAAHAVLLKAWLEVSKESNPKSKSEIPRPLDKQYVEHTCPADFENHETFARVAQSVMSGQRVGRQNGEHIAESMSGDHFKCGAPANEDQTHN